MRIVFEDGTLLLENAPESVPYAEWDDRVEEYRAQAHHYSALREWGHAGTEGQATLHESTAVVDTFEDTARSYSELQLTPAIAIEPRDYQQAALTAWSEIFVSVPVRRGGTRGRSTVCTTTSNTKPPSTAST